MVLFYGRKLIGLALILLIAFPLGAFAAEKKGTDHKKSVSRSSSKNMPQKRYRAAKVSKPSVGISQKKSVHQSSVKNVQQKKVGSRNDAKLKGKNPKKLAQRSSAKNASAKNAKEKGDRPPKVVPQPVEEISPPSQVRFSPAKKAQQKNHQPSRVSKPAGYASSADRMTPDHGSGNEVAAIWSSSDKNPETKINNQELYTYLNDNDLAEQNVNSSNIKSQGPTIKDYPIKNAEHLDKIIMITTPISISANNK
jgi:hypothetical protein